MIKPNFDQPYRFAKQKNKQSGAALIIFFIVLILAGSAVLFSVLDSNSVKIERDKKTAEALAEAKVALVGYAVKNSAVVSSGYLPSPDLGPGINTEGSSAGSMGSADISLIGKLPWRTLGVSPLKDGSGECIWYIVSGRFKNSPKTTVFNWDTQGQIDVIDGSGNAIATNLAALIVSPGQPLDAQNHALADPALTQCGGNYDARNYLDSYDSANAIAGEVNYFVGATNNRQAPNTNNKVFVFAKNDHYNDRYIFVTMDEVFRPINRRSDFSQQITALFDDVDFKPHLQAVAIAGSKGTDNVNCTSIANSTNKTFCKNWKEMLLLTQLPMPSSITIDGALTATCTRVLIFGGQKAGAQARITAANKTDPANYLEGTNLTAFATPTANNNSFIGASTFNANNPSADILRCL